MPVPKKPKNREQGYTEEEAHKVLRQSHAYHPGEDTRESATITSAKRWLPWLAYFSGARAGEIAQLRKQDICSKDGISYFRITPDAGTTKTGHFRDVPLHRQLIELGFLKFVEGSSDGPLFFRVSQGKNEDPVLAAEAVYGRVAKWLKANHRVPAEVAPMHGFRHVFKTIANIHGVSARNADAIQGHAGRIAGDGYGDVTLPVKHREIEKIPDVPL